MCAICSKALSGEPLQWYPRCCCAPAHHPQMDHAPLCCLTLQFVFAGFQKGHHCSIQPASLLPVLAQDTVLFADTVKRNILYGRPGASDDEIDRAAGQCP